jgi:hypothetical protein
MRTALLLLVALVAAAQEKPGVSDAEAARIRKDVIAPLAGRPQVEIKALAVGVLTNDSVRDDAELILRQSKIPVAEECEIPNCGRLIVIVELNDADRRVFHVAVEYREWVHLVRSAVSSGVSEPTFAAVWREDDFGQVGPGPSHVRDASKQLVEKFALDYLRANPTK